MPTCPNCGELVSSQATFCSKCGATLQPQQPFASPGPEPMPYSSQLPRTSQAAAPRSYVALGVLSAFLSLFIMPEIFASVAVILGAMVWKREEGNKGLYIIIAGLVCMVIGIEITAPIYLGAFLPY